MVFLKRVENFSCEVCGEKVEGDGYTDHCPKCLWSRHVDIEPGDRVSACGGLMEPVGVVQKHGEHRIRYRCQKCHLERENKVQKEDDWEKVVGLI
jgi:Zn finger protein HypA/HybF involved in hydrogenase expression